MSGQARRRSPLLYVLWAAASHVLMAKRINQHMPEYGQEDIRRKWAGEDADRVPPENAPLVESYQHKFLEHAKSRWFDEVEKMILAHPNHPEFVNVQPRGRWSALHQFASGIQAKDEHGRWSNTAKPEAVIFLLSKGADKQSMWEAARWDAELDTYCQREPRNGMGTLSVSRNPEIVEAIGAGEEAATSFQQNGRQLSQVKGTAQVLLDAWTKVKAQVKASGEGGPVCSLVRWAKLLLQPPA